MEVRNMGSSAEVIHRLNSLLEVGYRRGNRWFVLGSSDTASVGAVSVVYPVRLEDGSNGYFMVGDGLMYNNYAAADAKGANAKDANASVADAIVANAIVANAIAHVGAIEFVADGAECIHRVYDMVSGCWVGIRYRRSIGVVAYRTLAVVDAGSDDVRELVTEFIRPMMLGISMVPSIGLWVDGGSV
ncbi:MAG: hypothetical protein QXW98_06055, partial [Candidatus Caldarchaeum sp.]